MKLQKSRTLTPTKGPAGLVDSEEVVMAFREVLMKPDFVLSVQTARYELNPVFFSFSVSQCLRGETVFQRPVRKCFENEVGLGDTVVGNALMSDEFTQNLANDKLQQILDRFDGLEMRLGAVETRLTGIDERLQAIEAKAYDTKPIWERALAELLEVNRRLDSLDRRFSVLNDDVLHTDQRQLEVRTGDLEQTRS